MFTKQQEEKKNEGVGGGKKCTRGRDRVIKRHTNPPTMFTHAFVTTGLKITKQLRSTGLT